MEARDVNALFDECDSKAKGYLLVEEFARLCAELNLENEELQEVFNAIDTNNNGRIEKREFLEQFHTITNIFFDATKRNSEQHASEESKNKFKENVQKATTWDQFAEAAGHIVYSLPSYERICALYKDVEHNPILLVKFENMVRSVLKDVENLQESTRDLEATLLRVTKQSEEQLTLLESEMEAQMKTKERAVREEARRGHERERKQEKERYEERISKLQEAIEKLQQVDEKLSTRSPYEREVEKLREKLRSTVLENSNLQTRIAEADTNMTLLRSQIASLKLQLQEKTLEFQRESDAVAMVMSEQESMSQQVNSLYSHNQRLKNSHNDLRDVIDYNMATMHRMSTRMSRSPAGSCMDDLSLNISAQESRSGLTSGRTSRASFLDLDALAECDPGYRVTSPDLHVTSYDAGDDTEMDVSLKSSFDGGHVTRLGSAFGRDSGLGMTREDVDSELEANIATGSRFRTSGSYRSMPSLRYHHRNANGWNKNRRKSLDDDLSDENVRAHPARRRRRRKVLPPPTPQADGGFYKVILCGDSNVGKSSFITRLCQDRFTLHTRSTLGVDFQVKRVTVNHDVDVTMQLWDTAGQERFKSIASSYFRKADGVILLYDVTCQESFINVRDWMETISESAPSESPVLICGNKTDLRNGRGEDSSVIPSEGAQLAASYGVLFMEASARSGENVTEGVATLARHLAARGSHSRDEDAIKRLDGPRATRKPDCC